MGGRNRARASAADTVTSERNGSAASKAPATNRGRHTRDKLLEAARRIFSRTAFAEVRITDITAEAGVASGTFYTYFDTKEELFREIAVQVLKEMSDVSWGGDRDQNLSLAERVKSNTRRYFECVRENACIARSIEELRSRERSVGDARHETLVLGVQRIERLIGRLQEMGICDAAVDSWPTALVLHAMTVSVAYDHLVHRDAPEETEVLLDTTTRIWCSTLGIDFEA